MYKNFWKPYFEFILSIGLLIFFSPIFLVLTITGYVFLRENPFFFQERTGLKGRMFWIAKFKTMQNSRVTKYGSVLRRFSLDELPQLLNVISGHMSLIGPRPLLPEYLSFYNDFHMQRLNARPGITGWAQINGRNEISWEEKFKLDAWYVENLSLLLDLKIALKTLLNLNNRNTHPAKPFNINE